MLEKFMELFSKLAGMAEDQLTRVVSVKFWKNRKTLLWQWEIKVLSEDELDTLNIRGRFRLGIPVVTDVGAWSNQNGANLKSTPKERVSWTCPFCFLTKESLEDMFWHIHDHANTDVYLKADKDNILPKPKKEESSFDFVECREHGTTLTTWPDICAHLEHYHGMIYSSWENWKPLEDAVSSFTGNPDAIRIHWFLDNYDRKERTPDNG